MLDNMLIGLWSGHALYGGQSGAQSDDRLIFKPDGTGRYEFINWTLCSVDIFHWETPRANAILITGVKHLQAAADWRTLEEKPTLFDAGEMDYAIREGDTPSGQRMPVLRLPLKFPMEECFGFARADLSGLEEPEFDLER